MSSPSDIATVAAAANSQDCQESSRSTRLCESSEQLPGPHSSPEESKSSRSSSGGLHKHLLLITGHVYHEFIGECSVAASARDLHDLDSMLPETPDAAGDFVLVQVGTGWRLDVKLLDVLVDRLGNVSVYSDKKYYSKTMTKRCRNIGARCTLLVNLVPVLEQLESGAGMSWPESDSGGGMYNPDWIPVPALPPLPRNFTGSTEKQIEYLTWRLCVRDRRHNLYYRLDKDSPLSTLRYTCKHVPFPAISAAVSQFITIYIIILITIPLLLPSIKLLFCKTCSSVFTILRRRVIFVLKINSIYVHKIIFRPLSV